MVLLTDAGPFVYGECAVCDAGLPAARRGCRPRVICDAAECKAEYSGYVVRRAAVRKRTAPLPAERTCNGPCGRTLPLVESFARVGTTPEGRPQYQGTCKACRNAAARDRYAADAARRKRARAKAAARHEAERKRRAEDPDFDREVRARNAAARRAYRKAAPAKAAAERRKYAKRVAADPAKLRARREKSRMDRRLRAERAGRDPESMNRVRSVRERDERHAVLPRLPAAALAAAIERARPAHEDMESFAQRLGTTARSVFAWTATDDRAAERDLVLFDTADAILTELGLQPFDVWADPDVLTLFGC